MKRCQIYAPGKASGFSTLLFFKKLFYRQSKVPNLGNRAQALTFVF